MTSSQGGSGDDTLHGGSGDDQIIGDNFLSASANSTTYMFGDDGNDTLSGSAGKDVMDGGTGSDWADYTQQDFDPQLGYQVTGHDTGRHGRPFDRDRPRRLRRGRHLRQHRERRGTDGDDIITGDANDNFLVGMDGNNVIHGGDGNDTLMGNGELFGDDGNDTFMASGGEPLSTTAATGSDTVDYSQSSDRVVVDLGGSLAILGIQSGEIDSQGHLCQPRQLQQHREYHRQPARGHDPRRQQ